MKLNLGCGAYRIDGFDNLDKLTGWQFEDGLGVYADGSVEGATASHSLMYVPLDYWPAVFAEFARVLEPGGVIRITEDATDDPRSERFGGHHDAVTLTTATLVSTHLLAVGLPPMIVRADQTLFPDGSLIQNHHGGSPKAFFVEGVR